MARIEKYKAIDATADDEQDIAPALPCLVSFEVGDNQEHNAGSCGNPD
jgi:hypothetical protein